MPNHPHIPVHVDGENALFAPLTTSFITRKKVVFALLDSCREQRIDETYEQLAAILVEPTAEAAIAAIRAALVELDFVIAQNVGIAPVKGARLMPTAELRRHHLSIRAGLAAALEGV